MGALRNPNYRPTAIPSSTRPVAVPDRPGGLVGLPKPPSPPTRVLSPVGDNVVPLPQRNAPTVVPFPQRNVARPSPRTMPRIENDAIPFNRPAIPQEIADITAPDPLTISRSRADDAINKWLDRWGFPKWKENPSGRPDYRAPQWLSPTEPSPAPRPGSRPVPYTIFTTGGTAAAQGSTFVRTGPLRLRVSPLPAAPPEISQGWFIDFEDGSSLFINQRTTNRQGGNDDPEVSVSINPVNPGDTEYEPSPAPLPRPVPLPQPAPLPFGQPAIAPQIAPAARPLLRPAPFPKLKPLPNVQPLPSPTPLPRVPSVPGPGPRPVPSPSPVPAPSPSPFPTPRPNTNPTPGTNPNGVPGPRPVPNPFPTPNTQPRPQRNPIEELIERVIEEIQQKDCDSDCCVITSVAVPVFQSCDQNTGEPIIDTVTVSVLDGLQDQIVKLFEEVAEIASQQCFTKIQQEEPNVLASGTSSYENRVSYVSIPDVTESVVFILTGAIPPNVDLYATSSEGEVQAKFGNISLAIPSPGGGNAQDADPGWIWTRRTLYRVPLVNRRADRKIRISLKPGLSWVLYDSGERT